jgi:hypothetical protein
MGAFQDRYGRIYLDFTATKQSQLTNVTTKLHMCRDVTKGADDGHDPTRLKHHLDILAKALDDYIGQLEAIAEMLNDFQADVADAAARWDPPTVIDNGIPMDEDLLDRLGEFYGIPKPRPRR